MMFPFWDKRILSCLPLVVYQNVSRVTRDLENVVPNIGRPICGGDPMRSNCGLGIGQFGSKTRYCGAELNAQKTRPAS